ncbi:beta-ketoacyl-ACP synthase III [Streptomyces sp. 3MP-14]|uniref:Beta-ketoacyl-ACP synthase III n=1 Tax=Streptomyces mimosae TaxID=2586635 RepID=A0A5N6A1K5_9ACTN|nr:MULTISPECIES: beta-ketoacyl-ACP synthase 3 [Streptomyces]KAB8162122.1 beta-ketoacyl-ACP synthase III [Streptomyces mimosae]KAB8173980.1 beta-ketoacyl-ACP synthase III [Streptomyces sp. 3MP-14]
MNATGILGTGSYLPSEVVTNEEVGRGAGVTDEWITRKTGIRERRRAPDHQATSDLAAAAAERALAQAGVRPDQVRYLVVATSTPDHPQPATANLVQHLIGAVNAAAFDVNAVCSGFVYALTVAHRLVDALDAGAGDEPGYALVVGADIYSRIIDHSDRRTAALFGDGAGAVVLGRSREGSDLGGILATSLISRGDQHRLIGVAAGGSRLPASARTVADGAHHFRMDGRGVRQFVAENLPGAVGRLLARAGVRPEEVRHFVPHQANGVMLREVWPALRLDNATLQLTVESQGNTGAASVPVALDTVHRRGQLEEGDLVLLCAFGGGMSLGSTLVRWGRTRPVLAARQADAVPAGVPAAARLPVGVAG